MATPHINQSLKLSIREGMAAQVMVVIIDYFMVPCLLYMDGTIQQVALLVALPQLVASIAQLLSVKNLDSVIHRKKWVLIGIAIQAIAIVPIGALLFLPSSIRIEIFIFLILIHRVTSMLIGPIWGSIVSQYLPENKRGQYFGRRSQLIGWSSLVGIAISGLVLFLWRTFSLSAGFAFLFGMAATARFVSLYFMSQQTELPLTQDPKNKFTFWMFIRRYKESNFVKFVFFVALMTFATNIAAPFFSVFMLRDLDFSYLQYMSVHLMSVVAGFISFSIWGRHADVVGNARILKITGYAIPFIPLLWIGSTNPFYLVLVEIIGGFIWGGFNLCVLNFIYDAAIPEKRVRVMSYFNFINGIALFLGTLLGGMLVKDLPTWFGYPLYSLFVLSGLVRLIPAFGLSRFFKEVRPTSSIPNKELIFSVLGIHPIIGRNIDIK